MSKSSTKYSLPSAEHTTRDGVEGKICRGKHSRGEPHWCPLTAYWSNDGYIDGRSDTCSACYGIRKRERAAADKTTDNALILRDPRPVAFGDLGTRAHVGWYGDVEYFPITPLLALTRFTSERGLLGAIKSDTLIAPLAKYISVSLPTGAQAYRVWCLPWSHFNTFCLKFGNAKTKPQQERAQKVLEAAFGHTAESNVQASQRIDRGETPKWEENKQQHQTTHKMLEDIRGELRGATLYKDRVLVIRGSVYFIRLWPEMPVEVAASLIAVPFASEMWRKGYRLYKVGKTGKKATSDRLKQYATEARMVPPVQIAEIHVDDPDEAERLLKRLRPADAIAAEGCAEQFWCKPGIEERVRRSWTKTPTMAVEDMALRMRGWEIGAPVVVEQYSF